MVLSNKILSSWRYWWNSVVNYDLVNSHVHHNDNVYTQECVKTIMLKDHSTDSITEICYPVHGQAKQ